MTRDHLSVMGGLTPMGQVESYGDFARGLGARRIKVLGALFLLVGIAVIVVSEI